MILTHLSRPFYRFLCLCFITVISTNLAHAQAAVDEDPFADEAVYSLIPRMVHPAPTTQYLSPKVKDQKALEITSLFSTPIEYLPDAPTQLTKLPLIIDKTNQNHKIYDITSRFPNIKKGDQQWVHYNSTKLKITANANAYLRTSIREYVQRIEFTLPLTMRITGQLIEVDSKTESSLKNIQSLISKNSNLVKKLLEIDLAGRPESKLIQKREQDQFAIEAILDFGRSHVWALIDVSKEGSRGIQFTSILTPNETTILECGLTVAGKKQLLIIHPKVLTLSGRQIEITRSPPHVFPLDPVFIYDVKDDPFEQTDNKISIYKVPNDFLNLFENDDFKLLISPVSRYFNKNDIVYDITKLFNEAGINLDNTVYFNKTHSEIITQLNSEKLQMIEMLLYDMRCGGVPRTFFTRAVFYEVDSRKPTDQAWTTTSVLQSKPQPLYRFSISDRYGELSKITSPIGRIKLTNSASDDGTTAEQSWEIDIHHNGLQLKKNLEFLVPLNGTTIIDLKELGNGRSIIMVIETKEELYYKVENRFQQ